MRWVHSPVLNIIWRTLVDPSTIKGNYFSSFKVLFPHSFVFGVEHGTHGWALYCCAQEGRFLRRRQMAEVEQKTGCRIVSLPSWPHSHSRSPLNLHYSCIINGMWSWTSLWDTLKHWVCFNDKSRIRTDTVHGFSEHAFLDSGILCYKHERGMHRELQLCVEGT